MGEWPGFVGIGAVGGRFGVQVTGLGGWARFVARVSGRCCVCWGLGGDSDSATLDMSCGCRIFDFG